MGTTLKRRWTGSLLGAALLVLSGCQARHDVVVDAINDRLKPMGTSYRLDVHDPTGGVEKEQGVLAVALVKDALGARGLYEAPANVRPDMVIDAEYGVGPGHIRIERIQREEFNAGGTLVRVGKPGIKPIVVFEKYLSLSAREPARGDASPAQGRQPANGDELWNLRVSIEDEKKTLEPYLPVLASVSVDHIGKNSGKERHVVVTAGEAAEALRRRGAQRSSAQ